MCPPNVFIVMELLTGSLRQKLDEVGRLKYRDILVLANEISSALAYLHPTIVHRDLKPQNILIDGSGAAKVADFGIAKVSPNSSSFYFSNLNEPKASLSCSTDWNDTCWSL